MDFDALPCWPLPEPGAKPHWWQRRRMRMWRKLIVARRKAKEANFGYIYGARRGDIQPNDPNALADAIAFLKGDTA